jgi:hypothetical protein
MDIRELDSLGLLRADRPPHHLAWLTDDEKCFLIELLTLGDEGMHKRQVAKFTRKNPDAVLRLEIRELISWERDKAGRPMFVVLTWKGVEAAELLLQLARNNSRNPARTA